MFLLGIDQPAKWPEPHHMHSLRVAAALAAVVLLLAFAGPLGDVFGGFEFTRSAARSWPLWLGGLIVAGLIYAVTDGPIRPANECCVWSPESSGGAILVIVFTVLVRVRS